VLRTGLIGCAFEIEAAIGDGLSVFDFRLWTIKNFMLNFTGMDVGVFIINLAVLYWNGNSKGTNGRQWQRLLVFRKRLENEVKKQSAFIHLSVFGCRPRSSSS
jgi:hypothetical protein